MKDGIRQRLDDLEELLHEEYITGEEYATARENLLLDMGFDIVPRLEGPARREPQPAMQARKRQGAGCGCTLALLLLLVVAAGGALLALPEETLRQFPWTEKLMSMEAFQQVRQSLEHFIDDLRGNPSLEPSLEPSFDAAGPQLHSPAPDATAPASADERIEEAASGEENGDGGSTDELEQDSDTPPDEDLTDILP